MCCLCRIRCCCRHTFPECVPETSCPTYCRRTGTIVVLSFIGIPLTIFPLNQLSSDLSNSAKDGWNTIFYGANNGLALYFLMISIFCVFCSVLIVLYFPYQKNVASNCCKVVTGLFWVLSVALLLSTPLYLNWFSNKIDVDYNTIYWIISLVKYIIYLRM